MCYVADWENTFYDLSPSTCCLWFLYCHFSEYCPVSLLSVGTLFHLFINHLIRSYSISSHPILLEADIARASALHFDRAFQHSWLFLLSATSIQCRLQQPYISIVLDKFSLFILRLIPFISSIKGRNAIQTVN